MTVLASYDQGLRYVLRRYPELTAPPGDLLSGSEDEAPEPPLAPLEGHPNARALCLCSHSGSDHSHILYDAPCLECECWGFTFWRLRDTQELADFYTSYSEAVGTGLVRERKLLPVENTNDLIINRAQLVGMGLLDRLEANYRLPAHFR